MAARNPIETSAAYLRPRVARPERGDAWGGLAAMLVALPAAIGFGVAVFGALGTSYAVEGALAGIVGTVVLGLVAALLGGTDRLVSAPCAPAAAVLAAFALERVRGGDEPNLVVAMLLAIGCMAGLAQVALGRLGIGRLIRYIPYPVVSGYLTGVGLLVIASQVPRLVGLAGDTPIWTALASRWDWRALAIGALTVAAMVAAPRWIRRVPGTIIGILAGLLAYGAIALADPSLRQLAGNGLVLGSLGTTAGGLLDTLAARGDSLSRLSTGHLPLLFGTALTLAALLSIDTLKTCVVLDKLTRSRHHPDRELVAQGLANLASSLCGGLSGAGTMGATLVGLGSGSRTRATGALQALFALAAALALGPLIAWIPAATLAGILVAIGLRMIDRDALRYARTRATVLDFAVVVAVVVVALTVGLIAASLVGVGLSMVLFVREQSAASVVRHKLELGQAPSTWHRPEAEMDILARKSSQAVIFELQGALFFGNTYRLYKDLEHEIGTRRFVILDLKHVRSIDVTAAQLFGQVRDTIEERGARLLVSGVREQGDDSPRILLDGVGLLDAPGSKVRFFPDLDSAIAWVEERLVRESEPSPGDEPPMALREMEIFAGYKDETLADLESVMAVRRFAAGETIYARGSPGEELYWVRRGSVRLMASLGEKGAKQVAAFGRGDCFGGLAFLDNEPRPNEAVAATPTEVYVLTRRQFESIALRHKKLAFNLANAMARMLARRLRRAQLKLATLEEY